jgi:hypothetical protein
MTLLYIHIMYFDPIHPVIPFLIYTTPIMFFFNSILGNIKEREMRDFMMERVE